jgi:hypothetical protein
MIYGQFRGWWPEWLILNLISSTWLVLRWLGDARTLLPSFDVRSATWDADDLT